MKRLTFYLVFISAIIAGVVSCKKIDDIDARLSQVEGIVTQLQNQVAAGAVITSVKQEEGVTTITLSNGQDYRISDGNDGEAILADVKIEDDFVVLTLKSGETIRISYQNPLSFVDLNIIPDYTDGSVAGATTMEAFGETMYNFSLNVSVTPSKYAETIANSEGFVFKANFIPAKEKTKGMIIGDFSLTPTKINNLDGRLDVQFELDASTAEKIDKNLYTVSFSIEDSDGIHGAETPYLPVCSSATQNGGGGVSNGETPDVLPGFFAVSDTKKVHFSKGNLQKYYNDWKFYGEQYSAAGIYQKGGSYPEDLFTWSVNAYYGTYPYSINKNDYTGDFLDWGNLMSNDNCTWRTLSKDEWKYLFAHHSHRLNVTVNYQQHCMVIAPEGCSYIGESYTYDEWKSAEASGYVCLPPTGYRKGENVDVYETDWGYYWSSTNQGQYNAHNIRFSSNTEALGGYYEPRYKACAVRLVTDAEE